VPATLPKRVPYAGEVVRGPNIGNPPRNTAMPQQLAAKVTIKLDDKALDCHGTIQSKVRTQEEN
jgi:hypothetical protein